MAKISIKSEKTTPLGGIIYVRELFLRLVNSLFQHGLLGLPLFYNIFMYAVCAIVQCRRSYN